MLSPTQMILNDLDLAREVWKTLDDVELKLSLESVDVFIKSLLDFCILLFKRARVDRFLKDVLDCKTG